jgi:HSP20 family molecular chaperone IbpA
MHFLGEANMDNENTITKPPADEVDGAELTRCGCYYRPNVDILEQADELVVQADVPGASADGIGIDFEDGTLTIHAQVKPRQADDQDYLMREYGVGDYRRTFHVSEAIDAGKISAEYADGVLTLRLPKAEAVRPRKIPVRNP